MDDFEHHPNCGGVMPCPCAELRTLRATIKDAYATLPHGWKDCDATLGEAIAAELGEYDEANPEALSAALRENARLRARVAEMEADREAAFVALCLPPEARECWAVETLEDGVDLVNGWDKEQYAAYEQRIAKLERDARLVSELRATWNDIDPVVRETTTGALRVGLVAVRHFEAEEATAALRAEEGGEHG